MSDLMSLPPWKERRGGTKIFYKKEVEEGYFLEQLSIMTARLTDMNLTLRDLDVADFYREIIETLKNIEKKLG